MWDGCQHGRWSDEAMSCHDVLASGQQCEHKSWRLSMVKICYQVKADWEGLPCTLLICKVWRLAKALYLLVVTSCAYEWSLHQVINSNPIYSCTQARDNMIGCQMNSWGILVMVEKKIPAAGNCNQSVKPCNDWYMPVTNVTQKSLLIFHIKYVNLSDNRPNSACVPTKVAVKV